jgi:cation-transporting ATPase 13A3/4/5
MSDDYFFYFFCIVYGQVMMMLKIFTFYFSVSLSQNIWIAVDVFITVILTWAVSQSKPAAALAPQRPTAQLLGPQVLSSTIGLVAINWAFLIAAFALLYQQPWFRCNEFDSRAVDMSKWWLLADNYEGQVLALICVFQFINNAAVQNWGYRFRQSFHRNYILVGLWIIYFCLASLWCLADPNWFGCLFRFNCGTPQVLAEIGYTPPSTFKIEPYNTPLGHNVMPVEFRWKLWGLVVGNMAMALLWERGVILGPVHDYVAKTFPVKRLSMVH